MPDNTGKKYVNRNMINNFNNFKQIIQPFLPNRVVGCESTCSTYRPADGCRKHHIPFYPGHALYMKAISQNKRKSDKLDARTIAELLRTNFFPEAYALLMVWDEVLLFHQYLMTATAALNGRNPGDDGPLFESWFFCTLTSVQIIRPDAQ